MNLFKAVIADLPDDDLHALIATSNGAPPVAGTADGRAEALEREALGIVEY